MSAVGIENFSGMVPLRDPSLVETNYAQYCVNTYLYKGSIRGFANSAKIKTLQDMAASSIYRIPADENLQQDFTKSYWFEFGDEYMSVLRAPMIEDQFKRYYFFPSRGGAYFNTLANLQQSAPSSGPPGIGTPYDGWMLGIDPPTVAPTVAPATGIDEARAYVYTWENSFSEEGPPSPPTVADGGAIGVWTIGVTAPPPDTVAKQNLTTVNIYRTVTDSSGNANYYRVGSMPVTQTTFSDGITDSVAASNLALPSATWIAPPADLQGVVQMANGIMAGWSNKKEVWFSEAYTPHAWPAQYAITVPYPIVGLAAVGSTLIILTEGSPQVATGVTPGTITQNNLKANEPCIARGSIVAAAEGAYYASPNGLMLVSGSGVDYGTQNLFQKEDWLKTQPYSIAAARYANAYLAFNKDSLSGNNGFLIDHGAYAMATLTPAKYNTPFTWLSLTPPIVNIYSDELSGQIFYIANGAIWQWNPEAPDSYVPWVWQSKDFRFPFAQEFSCGVAYFNIPALGVFPVPDKKTRNVDQAQLFDPTKQLLLMRVFADGRQVLVRELQKTGELFKLPSGFKAVYWSFRFEGIVEMRFAEFATATKDLRKV